MKKRLFPFILAIALVGAALSAPAQTPDAGKSLPSKVQRLNRAPVNSQILKVKLPHPKEIHLPNGLTVLVLERHKLPTIYYSLWIKSGALSDPHDMPGLAAFTAEMLRNGTVTRSNAQIAMELDETGGTLNTDAPFGANVTTIQSNGLSQSADKLLELVSDIALHPSFPAEEVEKFRRQQKTRLVQLRSNPNFLARERFSQAVYGDFPAAVVSPTADSVQKITSEVLQDFHQKYYAPNNAILAVAGDITVEQATELVRKHLGAWKNAPVSPVKMAEVARPGAARIYLVDRPGSVQSNILVGGLSLRRADPDYVPLEVANRILGGSAAARLFANLREDKGYTYGAYSRVTSDLFPGTFSANTEVRNAVTDGSLHELMYELNRLRDEKTPSGELEEAKRSIVSGFALSLENTAGIINNWMNVLYYGLPEDYFDRYSDEVAKVDADAIQRVAKKYVDIDHLQIVVVGNAKEVREAVAKYGTVVLFDADGKPLESKAEAGTAVPRGK